jgi:hypothetical protein
MMGVPMGAIPFNTMNGMPMMGPIPNMPGMMPQPFQMGMINPNSIAQKKDNKDGK